MREFPTGATRDNDDGKIRYKQCLSPYFIQLYGRYILKHCQTADGLRTQDNWKKGMTKDSYMNSFMTHAVDLWLVFEGLEPDSGLSFEDLLCAVYFNLQGLAHEHLKEKQNDNE
jgi:hypothetical protein